MRITIEDGAINGVVATKPKQPEVTGEDVVKFVQETVKAIDFPNMHPVAQGAFVAWGLLGFYRGITYHSWMHKKDVRNYEDAVARGARRGRRATLKRPEQYFYRKFGFGLLSSFMYYVPVINLYYMSRELWRLEVNLRGMDVDTESEEYLHL